MSGELTRMNVMFGMVRRTYEGSAARCLPALALGAQGGRAAAPISSVVRGELFLGLEALMGQAGGLIPAHPFACLEPVRSPGLPT